MTQDENKSNAMNVDSTSTIKPLPRDNWMQLYDVDDLYRNATQRFAIDSSSSSSLSSSSNNNNNDNNNNAASASTTTSTSLLQMIVELHDAVSILPIASTSNTDCIFLYLYLCILGN